MDKSRGVTASTAQVRATRLNRGGSKAAKSTHTHCITYIVLTVLPDSLHLTKLFCVQSILAALHSPSSALPPCFTLFYSTMRCTMLHFNTSLLCHALYLTVLIVLHCNALYCITLHCNSMYCTVLMHYSCGMLHSSIIYFHPV